MCKGQLHGLVCHSGNNRCKYLSGLCSPLISGIVPIGEGKTVCAGSEKFYKMCESNEVYQIKHLTNIDIPCEYSICLFMQYVILASKVIKHLK